MCSSAPTLCNQPSQPRVLTPGTTSASSSLENPHRLCGAHCLPGGWGGWTEVQGHWEPLGCSVHEPRHTSSQEGCSRTAAKRHEALGLHRGRWQLLPPPRPLPFPSFQTAAVSHKEVNFSSQPPLPTREEASPAPALTQTLLPCCRGEHRMRPVTPAGQGGPNGAVGVSLQVAPTAQSDGK